MKRCKRTDYAGKQRTDNLCPGRKSLKKKHKSKGFAAGCSREVIERGADQLGWDLDRLLEMTLQAMAASEDIINAEMQAEQ